ncbi:MAG: ABC transporter permease [Acidobacteriota bacterium]|nr:ABC transporter permease [Blastocatellia bacterium]MDW8411710.1 ABC transporter permease [Acidobacteriota bacterium]
MSKTVLIIKREYLERVRSKWFIVGTLLGPVVLALLVIIPVVVMKLSSGQKLMAVVDCSGQEGLAERVVEQLKENKIEVKELITGSEEEVVTRQAGLNTEVEQGKLLGYVLLPKEMLSDAVVKYYAKNVSDFNLQEQLKDSLSKALVAQRLRLAGMSQQQIEELNRKVKLQTNKLEQGGQARADYGQTFVLAFLLMMLIYIMIVVYGINVLRSVAEEKQNRIVEIIVSSVSPLELLFGKIVGIGLVGLTQLLVWLLCALALPPLFAGMLVSIKSFLPSINLSIAIYFFIYFVLGYLLYAALYAMVGSMVSNEQDVQQIQAPVTILIVIPIILNQFVIADPSSKVSIVLSLFPFFSPVLMFLRITVQTPPFWQIALSIFLLVASVFLFAWVGSKIYRVGILMYGKRPSLPEVVKWLKYT